MAKKTNKTSHVMDLLTNGASGESTPANDSTASDASAAAGQEKKGDIQSHSVTPKKVTVVDEGSRNDRVSQEILNKLSEELEEDSKQKAAAPAETAPAETAPQAAENAPAQTSNRTMSADEIAAAFAASQQPAAAPADPALAETAPQAAENAPAQTSNRTMSADEIAAAFAASQQPAAAPADPAPAQASPQAAENAPAQTSNRTMSADEIAAAFAASQQPAAAPADPAPAQAAPQAAESAPAQADNAPTSSAAQPAENTANAAASAKITPRMVIPKSQISDDLTHDEYRFVNVMEQLILRQDIDSYLEQYNVCKCKRCVSDVCALALTGLPSKYVVTSRDSLSPILSYYENKFRIYMLTELIKACNKVRENPRHKK